MMHSAYAQIAPNPEDVPLPRFACLRQFKRNRKAMWRKAVARKAKHLKLSKNRNWTENMPFHYQWHPPADCEYWWKMLGETFQFTASDFKFIHC
tara:strand:- start:97 stop:378 length:282 start_codon:yes stop_codon:yes gene_type:complete